VKPKDPVPATDALFVNWPTPDAAIIISGEQLGYLEPCGCTAGQRGGLARRFDLVERLRKQGWKLALIDLGSLINDPNARLRGGPEETKVKFDYALKALALIGYDAVAISTVDLKIGIIDAVSRIINLGDQPKFVSANVEFNSAIAAPGDGKQPKFVPAVRLKRGPLTIGVTSVTDLADLDKLVDPDKDAVLTAKPADAAAKEALAALEKDTDIQVLMVQGSPEVAQKLAEANPGYDIVVATSPFADPEKEPKTLNGGKTMLVQVGRKGQYVGVVGLYKSGDPKYQRVLLGEKFDRKFEPMRKLMDEDMQEVLRSAGVLESFNRIKSPHGAPEGATYVGAETCKKCHPNTFAKWSSTKHAQAYADLVKDPHDPRRKREHDAECVTCHTTGFEYETGFRTGETTRYLKGNQCENCHGPGSAHSSDPDNKAFREAIARKVEVFRKSDRGCLMCHDEDNSPHFDFPTYWGKISHIKLDQYDKPELHKGIPAADLPQPKAN
jgi:hypothetical protein